MRAFTALLPALVLVSASSCGGDDVTDGGSGTDTGSGASGGSGVTDGAATDHNATAAVGGNTGGSSGSTEVHNGGAAGESGMGGSGTSGEPSGDGGSTGNEGGGGGSGGSAAGAGGSSGASGGTSAGGDGGTGGAAGDGGTGGAADDGGTGGTAANRCDDGTEVRCKMLPPECESYEMLAVQKSCYACVNPATCVPWGEETRCKNDMQCEPTHYCDPCATSSCPMCDDCVTACVPHGCRTESTLTCRCARPECGNEGVAVIRDGCWICLSIESCAPTGTGVRC